MFLKNILCRNWEQWLCWSVPETSRSMFYPPFLPLGLPSMSDGDVDPASPALLPSMHAFLATPIFSPKNFGNGSGPSAPHEEGALPVL